jgi:hypothetical protein
VHEHRPGQEMHVPLEGSRTMSAYHTIEDPSTNPAAAQAERRYEALRLVMSTRLEEVVERFITTLVEATNDSQHPVTVMLQDALDQPYTDAWDLDGAIQHLPVRHAAELGRSVMRLIGEAQLHVAEQLIDIAF